MQPITPANLIDCLNWRYATKKFDPTKIITTETWQALTESLVLTPSSYGLQPWKFIIITNPELKAKLKPLSWNQAQVTDCSHMVVFTIKKNLTAADVDRFVERTAEVRNSSIESIAGYRNMMVADVVDGARSFNVNEWASASTSPRVVMSHTGPANGTVTGEGITNVGYKVQISGLQEAGDDYTATLTYVATPTF